MDTIKSTELKPYLVFASCFILKKREGNWVLTMSWFSHLEGKTINSQIIDARGKEKSFKTVDAAYRFVYNLKVKYFVPATWISFALVNDDDCFA